MQKLSSVEARTMLATAGETIRNLVVHSKTLEERLGEYERRDKIAGIVEKAKMRGLIDDESHEAFIADLEDRDEAGLKVAEAGIDFAVNVPSIGSVREKTAGAGQQAINVLDAFLDSKLDGYA